jgi:hypothetical protein
MARWLIRERKSGTAEVSRSGRTRGGEHATVEKAYQHVAEHFDHGIDTVELEEASGVTTDITRQVLRNPNRRRRGWRQPK